MHDWCKIFCARTHAMFQSTNYTCQVSFTYTDPYSIRRELAFSETTRAGFLRKRPRDANILLVDVPSRTYLMCHIIPSHNAQAGRANEPIIALRKYPFSASNGTHHMPGSGLQFHRLHARRSVSYEQGTGGDGSSAGSRDYRTAGLCCQPVPSKSDARPQ